MARDFGQRRPDPPPTPPDARTVKRSRTVSLVLLVGAASGAWALGHLDSSQREEDTLVYPGERECAAEAKRSAADCAEAFRLAREAYPRIAPRYATNTDCEAHHGRDGCTAGGLVAPEAAGYFIPAFAGFMLGRTVEQALAPQPLFRHAPEEREREASSGGHGGGYCTSSGGRVYAASGGASSSARVASAVARERPSAARVVARGGLGSTGRAVASSGHSSGGHASSGG